MATKQPHSYGAKESDLYSNTSMRDKKIKEVKAESDPIKNVQKLGKLDHELDGGLRRKTENEILKKYQSSTLENSKHCSNTNTQISPNGRDTFKILESRNKDIGGQQSLIQTNYPMQIPPHLLPSNSNYSWSYRLIHTPYILYQRYITQPEFNYCIVPQQYNATKDQKNPAPTQYRPNIIKEKVTKERDLFKLLEECHTSYGSEMGFFAVEYDWTEIHLKLERGLNILATCKNYKCTLGMGGVVCPRGTFTARNGYCTLDKETFKVICPKCKQSIRPDESFGLGFYECSFQLTYRLVNQPEHQTRIAGKPNVFYFGKLCPFRERFTYLEAQISI